MPLADEDIPRAAIHEASHAVIAIEQGFFLYAVMLNGPAHKPGAIWREFPVGITAENNTAWAQRELAVFAAGYVGERVFFNNENREEWVTGASDADKPMVDYCAVQHLEIQGDLNLLQTPPHVPTHHWRDQLPQLHWADYDELIANVAGTSI